MEEQAIAFCETLSHHRQKTDEESAQTSQAHPQPWVNRTVSLDIPSAHQEKLPQIGQNLPLSRLQGQNPSAELKEEDEQQQASPPGLSQGHQAELEEGTSKGPLSPVHREQVQRKLAKR